MISNEKEYIQAQKQYDKMWDAIYCDDDASWEVIEANDKLREEIREYEHKHHPEPPKKYDPWKRFRGLF